MRKIILLIHFSLDGFVAGPGGDLSWFTPSDENLAFVNGLTVNADAALFGRNCYELLDDYWPSRRDVDGATAAEVAYSNWYNAAEKIVVSTTLHDRPGITLIREPSELQNMKQQPGKDILIFGSPSLSQSLLENGFIDEVWAFIHPHFFGQGLQLFSLPKKTDLTLLQTDILSTGEIALHYRL